MAAAKINGLQLEVVTVHALEGDCKKPEFLAKWPMGKIPAFEGTDGLKLIEGRAIARYSESCLEKKKAGRRRRREERRLHV